MDTLHYLKSSKHDILRNSVRQNVKSRRDINSLDDSALSEQLDDIDTDIGRQSTMHSVVESYIVVW